MMEDSTDRLHGYQSAETNREIPEIGIGMLGYAFMGKAHTNAFRKITFILKDPPAIPKLVAICGRDKAKVAQAAEQYDYKGYYTDWRQMIDDESIQLFDKGGPNNLHADTSIEAMKAGKHVLCEKSLERTSEEAWRMLTAARKYQTKHMVAFNYRFVPAIRFLKSLIENESFGKIYHFRAIYLQDWLIPRYETPRLWRLSKEEAGSGAMGDLGSHIIDLAHFLVGSIKSVGGLTHTFVHEITHFLDCIVNNKEVGPYGATFEDGYRACVVSDAILESSKQKCRVDCKY